MAGKSWWQGRSGIAEVNTVGIFTAGFVITFNNPLLLKNWTRLLHCVLIHSIRKGGEDKRCKGAWGGEWGVCGLEIGSSEPDYIGRKKE